LTDPLRISCRLFHVVFSGTCCRTLQHAPTCFKVSFSSCSTSSSVRACGGLCNTSTTPNVLQQMQRVAACCSVLQCVAACCNVVQCGTVCCSVKQCMAWGARSGPRVQSFEEGEGGGAQHTHCNTHNDTHNNTPNPGCQHHPEYPKRKSDDMGGL